MLPKAGLLSKYFFPWIIKDGKMYNVLCFNQGILNNAFLWYSIHFYRAWLIWLSAQIRRSHRQKILPSATFCSNFVRFRDLPSLIAACCVRMLGCRSAAAGGWGSASRDADAWRGQWKELAPRTVPGGWRGGGGAVDLWRVCCVECFIGLSSSNPLTSPG